jgi:hypothetical protein
MLDDTNELASVALCGALEQALGRQGALFRPGQREYFFVLASSAMFAYPPHGRRAPVTLNVAPCSGGKTMLACLAVSGLARFMRANKVPLPTVNASGALAAAGDCPPRQRRVDEWLITVAVIMPLRPMVLAFHREAEAANFASLVCTSDNPGWKKAIKGVHRSASEAKDFLVMTPDSLKTTEMKTALAILCGKGTLRIVIDEVDRLFADGFRAPMGRLMTIPAQFNRAPVDLLAAGVPVLLIHPLLRHLGVTPSVCKVFGLESSDVRPATSLEHVQVDNDTGLIDAAIKLLKYYWRLRREHVFIGCMTVDLGQRVYAAIEQCAELNAAVDHVVVVCGDVDTGDMRASLAKLASREASAVIATSKLASGVSDSGCASRVILLGCHSVQQLLQYDGRQLRVPPPAGSTVFTHNHFPDAPVERGTRRERAFAESVTVDRDHLPPGHTILLWHKGMFSSPMFRDAADSVLSTALNLTAEEQRVLMLTYTGDGIRYLVGLDEFEAGTSASGTSPCLTRRMRLILYTGPGGLYADATAVPLSCGRCSGCIPMIGGHSLVCRPDPLFIQSRLPEVQMNRCTLTSSASREAPAPHERSGGAGSGSSMSNIGQRKRPAAAARSANLHRLSVQQCALLALRGA